MMRLTVVLICLVVHLDLVATKNIEHEPNLIWTQTPLVRAYSNSRLMAIPGRPLDWVTWRHPDLKLVEAPHFTWEFKALGFHWNDRRVFWSESTNKKIQSVYLNGSLDITTIFNGTSSEVAGLAVDWMSQNLYFTDALYNWIMLVPITPGRSGYRIVVQDGLDGPHGVAVDPSNGYLFWSDWGARPKIERSDLLGNSRTIFIDRDMLKPRGMTIDYSSDTLYWVDSEKCTVELSDLDGRNRKVLDQIPGTTFMGIAVYENLVFITEQMQGMLHVFSKHSVVTSYRLGANPWDIVMYDESQQMGNSTECDELACDQICVYNSTSGAYCVCGEGYIPADEEARFCNVSKKFVHPSHIYAIGSSICHYPANMADMSLDGLDLGTQCFRAEMVDEAGYMTLTYDAAENTLYYFGNFAKTIMRLPLEIGAHPSLVVGGIGVVKGMSLDWVSGNLYWTDNTHNSIMVARKDGFYQRVLMEKLGSPLGIAVHPSRVEMYWTEHNPPSVKKASLSGTNIETVMTEVGLPNHLFIDFSTDSLYWADSVLFHVRKLDLATGRITVVYEQDKVKFYGISWFNDYLIWTDSDDFNGVHMARMDKKEKVRGIIHPGVGLALDVVTVDTSHQPPLSNPCGTNMSKCSQLCIASDTTTPACYCGLGYSLSQDGYSCFTAPVTDNFLLVSDGYQRKVFQLDLITGRIHAVDIDTGGMAVAVAFDPRNNMVYWSDNSALEIRRTTLDNRIEQIVRTFNSSSVCDGIAIDHINQLLFYTDTGNNLIGVVGLDHPEFYAHIITENLDEPRDIVVSPKDGQIYWSDWGMNSRIERASMDGSNRRTIYKGRSGVDTSWFNGLALDWDPQGKSMLYWIDAFDDSVNVIDLSTMTSRLLLKEASAHYFSIDVIGQYLYVTDFMKNYVRRMPKTGGPLTKFGSTNFTRLYDISGFNATEVEKGISLCAYSACEQMCLPKEGGGHTCRCAEGYVSYDNGISCEKVTPTTTPATTTTRDVTTSALPPNTTTTSGNHTASATSSPSTLTSSLPPSPPSPTITQTWPPSTDHWQKTTQPVMTITYPDVTTTGKSAPYTAYTSGTDVYISTTQGPFTTSRNNRSSSKSTARDKPGLLSPLIITIIACCVLIILVALILFLLYKKRYLYHIRHGKLVEEERRSSYYQIAFNGRGDHVTFDSGVGGIENPTYDCLNEPVVPIPDS